MEDDKDDCETENRIYPLFLKVHDSVVCYDENNFIKSNANKIDTYKFDHADPQAFLKLRQSGTSILSLFSIENCLVFLKSDIVNDKINQEHLNVKFKFSLKWDKDTNSFGLKNSTSTKIIKINDSSPGEQLMLLFLLWQYIFKKFKVNGRALLLFDEPDAHLHPASVKSFLKIIIELVEIGVQVIITTHNPTTISLASNENLFNLNSDEDDSNRKEKLKIEKVKFKNVAIDLLTENFVYVSEPFKVVFTEGNGKSDNHFYNFIKKAFFEINSPKSYVNQLPFLFRSIGSCHFRYFFDKKIILQETSGECNHADKIIFGINDGDKRIIHAYEYFQGIARTKDFKNVFDSAKIETNLEETRDFLNQFNRNLLRLDRYAIENYIYDPINIFFSLKNGPEQDFLKFPPKFNEYKKDSLVEFLNRKDLKLKEKEDLLNEILDITAISLTDFFIKDFSSVGKEARADLRETERDSFMGRFGFKDTKIENVLEICQKLPKYEGFKLIFKKDNQTLSLNLKYNPLLIFLKGHLIEGIFNSKIKFHQDSNGKSISWYDKLVNNPKTGFLFTSDLNEMIEKLTKD